MLSRGSGGGGSSAQVVVESRPTAAATARDSLIEKKPSSRPASQTQTSRMPLAKSGVDGASFRSDNSGGGRSAGRAEDAPAGSDGNFLVLGRGADAPIGFSERWKPSGPAIDIIHSGGSGLLNSALRGSVGGSLADENSPRRLINNSSNLTSSSSHRDDQRRAPAGDVGNGVDKASSSGALAGHVLSTKTPHLFHTGVAKMEQPLGIAPGKDMPSQGGSAAVLKPQLPHSSRVLEASIDDASLSGSRVEDDFFFGGNHATTGERRRQVFMKLRAEFVWDSRFPDLENLDLDHPENMSAEASVKGPSWNDRSNTDGTGSKISVPALSPELLVPPPKKTAPNGPGRDGGRPTGLSSYQASGMTSGRTSRQGGAPARAQNVLDSQTFRARSGTPTLAMLEKSLGQQKDSQQPPLPIQRKQGEPPSLRYGGHVSRITEKNAAWVRSTLGSRAGADDSETKDSFGSTAAPFNAETQYEMFFEDREPFFMRPTSRGDSVGLMGYNSTRTSAAKLTQVKEDALRVNRSRFLTRHHTPPPQDMMQTAKQVRRRQLRNAVIPEDDERLSPTSSGYGAAGASVLGSRKGSQQLVRTSFSVRKREVGGATLPPNDAGSANLTIDESTSTESPHSLPVQLEKMGKVIVFPKRQAKSQEPAGRDQSGADVEVAFDYGLVPRSVTGPQRRLSDCSLTIASFQESPLTATFSVAPVSRSRHSVDPPSGERGGASPFSYGTRSMGSQSIEIPHLSAPLYRTWNQAQGGASSPPGSSARRSGQQPTAKYGTALSGAGSPTASLVGKLVPAYAIVTHATDDETRATGSQLPGAHAANAARNRGSPSIPSLSTYTGTVTPHGKGSSTAEPHSINFDMGSTASRSAVTTSFDPLYPTDKRSGAFGRFVANVGEFEEKRGDTQWAPVQSSQKGTGASGAASPPSKTGHGADSSAAINTSPLQTTTSATSDMGYALGGSYSLSFGSNPNLEPPTSSGRPVSQEQRVRVSSGKGERAGSPGTFHTGQGSRRNTKALRGSWQQMSDSEGLDSLRSSLSLSGRRMASAERRRPTQQGPRRQQSTHSDPEDLSMTEDGFSSEGSGGERLIAFLSNRAGQYWVDSAASPSPNCVAKLPAVACSPNGAVGDCDAADGSVTLSPASNDPREAANTIRLSSPSAQVARANGGRHMHGIDGAPENEFLSPMTGHFHNASYPSSPIEFPKPAIISGQRGNVEGWNAELTSVQSITQPPSSSLQTLTPSSVATKGKSSVPSPSKGALQEASAKPSRSPELLSATPMAHSESVDVADDDTHTPGWSYGMHYGYMYNDDYDDDNDGGEMDGFGAHSPSPLHTMKRATPKPGAISADHETGSRGPAGNSISANNVVSNGISSVESTRTKPLGEEATAIALPTLAPPPDSKPSSTAAQQAANNSSQSPCAAQGSEEGSEELDGDENYDDSWLQGEGPEAENEVLSDEFYAQDSKVLIGFRPPEFNKPRDERNSCGVLFLLSMDDSISSQDEIWSPKRACFMRYKLLEDNTICHAVAEDESTHPRVMLKTAQQSAVRPHNLGILTRGPGRSEPSLRSSGSVAQPPQRISGVASSRASSRSENPLAGASLGHAGDLSMSASAEGSSHLGTVSTFQPPPPELSACVPGLLLPSRYKGDPTKMRTMLPNTFGRRSASASEREPDDGDVSEGSWGSHHSDSDDMEVRDGSQHQHDPSMRLGAASPEGGMDDDYFYYVMDASPLRVGGNCSPSHPYSPSPPPASVVVPQQRATPTPKGVSEADGTAPEKTGKAKGGTGGGGGGGGGGGKNTIHVETMKALEKIKNGFQSSFSSGGAKSKPVATGSPKSKSKRSSSS